MMHDVVIIGAGHNGLVCSAYLAMAGLKVLVLDQRSIAGGAAVTEEFSPGPDSARQHTRLSLQGDEYWGLYPSLRDTDDPLPPRERPLASWSSIRPAAGRRSTASFM